MRIATWFAFGLLSVSLCVNLHATGQEKAKKKPNVYTDVADTPIDYKIQGEYTASKRAAQVAHFLLKRRNACVAHAQLYSHEADILDAAVEREPSLLTACLRRRQRRARFGEFFQKCAGTLFPAMAKAHIRTLIS